MVQWRRQAANEYSPPPGVRFRPDPLQIKEKCSTLFLQSTLSGKFLPEILQVIVQPYAQGLLSKTRNTKWSAWSHCIVIDDIYCPIQLRLLTHLLCTPLIIRLYHYSVFALLSLPIQVPHAPSSPFVSPSLLLVVDAAASPPPFPPRSAPCGLAALYNRRLSIQ